MQMFRSRRFMALALLAVCQVSLPPLASSQEGPWGKDDNTAEQHDAVFDHYKFRSGEVHFRLPVVVVAENQQTGGS
jgi:hypothetical protein